MRLRVNTWVVAAILLLVASPLMAQTSGRIEGTVRDDTGALVPGAVVTATGSLGSNTTTTDSDGEYRFASVRPGTYVVRVELEGFKTVEQTGVIVGIDRTVRLRTTLELASVTETVTVTGESPSIDVASATTGVNATADLFEKLPIARGIYSIAQLAPGVQEDFYGAAVAGATSAENAYIIEGLNTTGVELGVESQQLNFDFVEEVEIKTGGLPAEYGRMTGGAINVLTKSGGNQFHGGLFGFYEGGSLFADNTTASQRHQDTTTTRSIDSRYDFGGDLGGYLVKDKLWFFGAYNRTNRTDDFEVIRTISSPGSPAIGSVIPRDQKSDLFAGKLTWRLSPSHTLTGSIFGDPTTREGPIFTISGPQSTWDGTRKFGATDYVVRYDGTLNDTFLIRAMWGRHNESDFFTGPGKEIENFIDQTVTPLATSGGFTFHSDNEFKRDVLKLDLTQFVGSHEIKLGGDYEKVQSTIARFNGGGPTGQRIYKRSSAGTIYYRHRFFVDDTAAGFDRDDPTSWTIAAPLVSAPRTKNFSLYAQDSWRLNRRVTLNLGLRWESQDVQNRDEETAFKLSDNWSPRIGLIFDVTGDGKSKLYANYGRFYENIPQDINIRAFGGEVQCFCYNFDPNPNNILPDDAAPANSSLLGGATPVDPDLKGQYIDEILGGAEYEVAPNFVLGTKVAYRKLGRVIEDFLNVGIGNYNIANPGEGSLGQNVTFYDYYYYDADDPRVTAPAPAAERKYWSFEVNARKRYSDGWQMLASYLWNSLEGNYDGLFQNSTGQLDPNINSAYDYGDFTVNAQGPLSSERKHQLKLYASYQVTSGGALDGLNVGLATRWYSGLPLNAYGYSQGYQNNEFYIAPRGSVGRGPSNWEADLHLAYPIKVGERARLNVIADVFNVFNRQAVIVLDERFNRSQDEFCAGIPDNLCSNMGGIDHIAGTTDPVGAIGDYRAASTNPDYLTSGTNLQNSFTLPRSIRVGVRLSF